MVLANRKGTVKMLLVLLARGCSTLGIVAQVPLLIRCCYYTAGLSMSAVVPQQWEHVQIHCYAALEQVFCSVDNLKPWAKAENRS